MSFGLLSAGWIMAGVGILAVGLWLLQRLRVQHREVEVLSTLFWDAAIEETRARVFVRKFRHWWAWLLLVGIASLMWILLGEPRQTSEGGVRHVVLVDLSVADDEVRQGDIELAAAFAEGLPTGDREIVAVGTQMDSLLLPDEPVELARLRSQDLSAVAPRSIEWAIESLVSRAQDDRPIAIHLVGSEEIEADRLDQILSAAGGSTETSGRRLVSVDRIERDEVQTSLAVQTLGISDAADGRWDVVDLWFRCVRGNEATETIEPDQVALLHEGESLPLAAGVLADGTIEVKNLPADGREITIAVSGVELAAVTLPDRKPIRVAIESQIPTALRELIALDPACVVVTGEADIRIGSTPECNFRLTSEDEPAFVVEAPSEDADEDLVSIVDELALRQIDATRLAEQAGVVIDIQLVPAATRGLALWDSLFSATYDFRESRACPVLVARSIRWLANRPPEVQWAALGERLPAAAPEYGRAVEETATARDGRQFRTTLLTEPVSEIARLETADAGIQLGGIGLFSWLGVLLAALLIGEWILFQRGELP